MPDVDSDLKEAARFRALSKRSGLSAAAKGKFEKAAKRLDDRAGRTADRTARRRNSKRLNFNARR